MRQTASNLEELGVNPTKGFLVGGISAGANFASIVSHLYRDEKLSPPLTGVYLSIPPVVSRKVVPEKYKNTYLSLEQNKDAPSLNKEVAATFDSKSSHILLRSTIPNKLGLYAAGEPTHLLTPILFESHKDLPPTYFQICGLDPLRDEGFIYEDILKENGVETKTDIYPGLPHGFWSWFPEAEFTKKFIEDCKNGMSWLLEKSSK